MLVKVHLPKGAPYYISCSFEKGVFGTKKDHWTSVKINDGASDQEILNIALDNLVKQVAIEEYGNVRLYKTIYIGEDVVEMIKG